MILASHVQAIGLSQRVRQRTATERPLDTPFAGLASAVHDYVSAAVGSERFEAEETAVKSFIARCSRALAEVTRHLANYGVSIDLVYQLERAQLSLQRMEAIIELHGRRGRDPVAVAHFIAALIRANDAQDSIRALLRENLKLMTRRIVESARKTGDHYITRDGGEYRAMLVSAAIGGALTGLTVLVKIATVGHGLPLFIEGLVASTNYALSFVLIHLLHGTLATKQPAVTAAAMAHKLNAPRAHGRLRGFVDEVANLVRSQVAAIMGNLLLVVPAALALQAILLLAGFGHLPDPAHAGDYIQSLSLWSAAPFYAAFTGVLLWLSAVIAGWFENWATFRRLPEAVARSPRIVAIAGAGARGTRGAAHRGERRGAGRQRVAGNPARHGARDRRVLRPAARSPPRHAVHRPAGARVMVVRHRHISLPAFWWAVAGIGAIGFLNLTVSFGLALGVAIRSTGRGAVSRRRLRRAVFARVQVRAARFPAAAARGTPHGRPGSLIRRNRRHNLPLCGERSPTHHESTSCPPSTISASTTSKASPSSSTSTGTR